MFTEAISVPYAKGFQPGGLRILGESHYEYRDDNGDWEKPSGHTHCAEHISWLISQYHTGRPIPRFDVCLSKALANNDDPTRDQVHYASGAQRIHFAF